MMFLKPRVLIYGTNHQAEQLFALLKKEKVAKVCGFIVDEGYKRSDYLLGKKVYEYNEMKRKFSNKKYQIILSFGYKNMVKNRQEKFEKCKNDGYKLFTYVSRNATVYAEKIGEGCIIYPHVYIAPFVNIGDGCFFEAGVTIAHHSKCGNFVFFAPNAVICGDTNIESNCFIGANAVVTNALVLKERTLVAAGAKVSHSTECGMMCFPAKTYIKQEGEPEEYI